jgi:hypothetical protein
VKAIRKRKKNTEKGNKTIQKLFDRTNESKSEKVYDVFGFVNFESSRQ